MDTDRLWDITNKILAEREEQFAELFSEMGNELDKQLEAEGVDLMVKAGNGYKESKARILALECLSSSISITAFLRMSWHSILDKEETK